MYSRIVVPLDGSELAETALETARAFARTFEASIHLIQVVDAEMLEPVGGSALGFDYSLLADSFQSESDEAQEYVAAHIEDLESDGFTATGDVLVGQVARVILSELQSGDLVVMASHGRTGVRRWVLGSVAEEIMRHADVPVLLVKQRHGDAES